MNSLYYCDNIEVGGNSIYTGSVDLIYLDPPFNSNVDYNIIFRTPKQGNVSHAQITAFEDTWHWNDESSRILNDLFGIHGELAELLDLLVRRLGHNDLSAYLVMMAIRKRRMASSFEAYWQFVFALRSYSKSLPESHFRYDFWGSQKVRQNRRVKLPLKKWASEVAVEKMGE